jgi:hypothetical protein
MKHKQLSKLVALAESMGFTVDDVVKGKHYKLYLSTPAGKKVLVVSITASDGRAAKNNEAIMKRWKI